MKFYRCKHCGNIIVYMHDSGVPVVCCGEKPEELTPGAVEAATEKHIPVISADGKLINVKVGSVEHPSLPEHYIMFIVLETDKGFMTKNLNPGDKPCADFMLTEGETAVRAYEYCNLHGLWAANV
ncbi:MAG: desulfoferrodoxin Dfx [Ruminococcus sp.]|nr:desulfoferrodoxin Dfx [Ruminococcus sp.]